jgi:hypothetical protein
MPFYCRKRAEKRWAGGYAGFALSEVLVCAYNVRLQRQTTAPLNVICPPAASFWKGGVFVWEQA